MPILEVDFHKIMLRHFLSDLKIVQMAAPFASNSTARFSPALIS
jgi:hypothetical protein